MIIINILIYNLYIHFYNHYYIHFYIDLLRGLGIGDWAQSPIPNPHPQII